MYNKLIVLLFCLILLIVYVQTNTEPFTEQVPAIILMRHGEELSKGPPGPDREYKFKDPVQDDVDHVLSIKLSSDRQTLNPTADYGIKDAKTLLKRLQSKMSKYKPIDTIFTINPLPTNNDYPTTNPFLTAYYVIYGESGDTPTPQSLSNIKVTLFDSKLPNVGKDGCKNPDISPENIYKYINNTKNSVLIIGTRDTIWGPAGSSTPSTDALISQYLTSAEMKNAVLPAKARTAFVISGPDKNKLEVLDIVR